MAKVYLMQNNPVSGNMVTLEDYNDDIEELRSKRICDTDGNLVTLEDYQTLKIKLKRAIDWIEDIGAPVPIGSVSSLPQEGILKLLKE